MMETTTRSVERGQWWDTGDLGHVLVYAIEDGFALCQDEDMKGGLSIRLTEFDKFRYIKTVDNKGKVTLVASKKDSIYA